MSRAASAPAAVDMAPADAEAQRRELEAPLVHHRSGPRPDDAVSQVSSVRSIRSVARREEADRVLEEERQRLMDEVNARIAARRVKVEAGLDALDLESELGQVEHPARLSATAAEEGVLRRRMEESRNDYLRYAALYRTRTGTAPPGLDAGAALAPRRFSPIDTPAPVGSVPKDAEVSTKHKMKEPKAWTGAFNNDALETWLRSATLYLEYLGIGLDDFLTPRSPANATARYSIRSLFSPEVSGDGVSPQQWFDDRDDRGVFNTPRDVLVAVRSHWQDDAAIEKAWVKYRSARQGALSARAFGARIDSLANALSDRVIDDSDRKLQFISNLNDEVKVYVKSHLPREERLAKLDGRLVTFDDVVRLAGETDSLGLTKPAKPATSSSSSFLKKAAGTDGSVSKQSSSSSTAMSVANPTRDRGPSTGWARSAAEWQAKNPAGVKAASPNTSTPHDSLRCFNCGDLGKHFSSACPNARRSPASVLVAALGVSVPSPAADLAPTVPSGGGASEASSSISGNAAGAEE